MKKILCALALLFSPYVLAQSIPDAFIGTWGSGESCENPASIEKQYISANENMAPMFVDNVEKINHEKIKVSAVKSNHGATGKDKWTLMREKEYLIIDDKNGKRRFLKSCNSSAPAEHAEKNRWRLLSDKPDLALMLDTESITQGSLWVKIEYKTTELFAGEPIGYVLVHNEYDCKRRTGGAVQFIIHSRNRSVIKEVNEPLNRYKAILPESMDETFMNLSCKE